VNGGRTEDGVSHVLGRFNSTVRAPSVWDEVGMAKEVVEYSDVPGEGEGLEV